MRNIKYCAIFLILILFLLFPPPVSYSSQLFYTIQTGSFTNVADAQKQFDFIVRGLNKKDVEDIEKEFSDSTEVNTFVSVMAPLLTAAMKLRTGLIITGRKK